MRRQTGAPFINLLDETVGGGDAIAFWNVFDAIDLSGYRAYNRANPAAFLSVSGRVLGSLYHTWHGRSEHQCDNRPNRPTPVLGRPQSCLHH